MIRQRLSQPRHLAGREISNVAYPRKWNVQKDFVFLEDRLPLRSESCMHHVRWSVLLGFFLFLRIQPPSVAGLDGWRICSRRRVLAMLIAPVLRDGSNGEPENDKADQSNLVDSHSHRVGPLTFSYVNLPRILAVKNFPFDCAASNAAETLWGTSR